MVNSIRDSPRETTRTLLFRGALKEQPCTAQENEKFLSTGIYLSVGFA